MMKHAARPRDALHRCERVQSTPGVKLCESHGTVSQTLGQTCAGCASLSEAGLILTRERQFRSLTSLSGSAISRIKVRVGGLDSVHIAQNPEHPDEQSLTSAPPCRRNLEPALY